MSRKIIEQYRRRSDFDADHCTPIRLSDGQHWYFPRPLIEITPVFSNGKAVNRTKQLTMGPELDVLIEAIATEEDGAKQVMAVLSLGALLLTKCYDLTDADFETLFRYRPADPDSQEMLKSILAVATGNASVGLGWKALSDPKACAAGAASPC